ncbi:uncharacterized protein LOC144428217 [Styela clava]
MLMIGVNVPEVFWVKDERRGTTNEPVAKRSILGWSLVGPAFNKASRNESFHVQVNLAEVKREDQRQIREMWETDFKYISLTPTPTLSREDKYALQLMEDNIKMVDGHYQSPLPWKPGCPEFPNNLDTVMRRTNNLGKRLLRNDVLRDKYCSTIAEFIKKGWARKIPAAEFEAPIGKAWYLPHQPVTSEHKPGKVRLVFDAGARYLNTSLNDQLLQGPDKWIVIYIEAMFLQACVTPRDVDVLRFLFWPDGDLTKTPVDHQMLVHCFGNTSSPFCANYCLRRTAEDFGKDFPSDISDNIKDNSYIDDFLLGADCISEGKRIVKQTSELTECGGFHLNKWRSNSEEIISCVPKKDRAQIQANVNLDPNRFERVLGVVWFVIEDCFGFNTKLKTKPATKRGVLAILSSVFDPMGIVSPVILQARLIFQELCRRQLGWDETIGENEQIAWESWTKAIPELSEVKLPRYNKPNLFGVIVSQELHHFGDASQTICSLPRLEITAAALCVRVDMFLRRQLKFEKKSIFWSDSTATIQSLYNSSKRFPTFIANRLAKIEEGSEPHQWHYVPSELNPADYASRGMTAKKLIAKKSWLQGPEFLYQNEENWPQMPVKLPHLPLEFIQKKPMNVLINLVTENEPLDKFINYYSSWYKLKKATAWIIRFKIYLQAKPTVQKGKLQTEEFGRSENELINYLQNSELNKVIAKLQNSDVQGKSVLRNLKIAPSMQKLNPVLINGILRVGGRLQNAPIEFDLKHPIILPSNHHITQLIVREYHKSSHHCGASHTWNLLRQKFWIINGAVVVKRNICNCIFLQKEKCFDG